MFLLLLLSVSLLPNLTPRLPLSFCTFLQLTLSSSPHSSVCLPPLVSFDPSACYSFFPILLTYYSYLLCCLLSLCVQVTSFSPSFWTSFLCLTHFFLFDFFKGDCLELWSQKRKGLLGKRELDIWQRPHTVFKPRIWRSIFWQSRITEQLGHPSVFPFWTHWTGSIYIYIYKKRGKMDKIKDNVNSRKLTKRHVLKKRASVQTILT